jgi:hypothetical protein
MTANFRLLARERGKIVPGSLREGHNVFTVWGRQWMAYLSAWKSIADPDLIPVPTETPHHDLRVRWLQLGQGTQLEEKDALNLVSPLALDPTPYYGKLVSVSFPFQFGVRFSASLDETSPGSSALLQEAGLSAAIAPAPAGVCSIDWKADRAVVTGVSQMLVVLEQYRLAITGSDHDGSYAIRRVLSETSVELEAAYGTGDDTNNPSVAWSLAGSGVGPFGLDDPLPVVAYKTFEPLVKTPDFELEVQWDFKFV